MTLRSESNTENFIEVKADEKVPILVRTLGHTVNRIQQHLKDLPDEKNAQDFIRVATEERLDRLDGNTDARILPEAMAWVRFEMQQLLNHGLRIAQAIGILDDTIRQADVDQAAVLDRLSGTLTRSPVGESKHRPRFVVVNTNAKDGPACDTDMLKNAKAATYYDQWQRLLENNVKEGDTVFLYRSGNGFVAVGTADDKPHRDRIPWEASEEKTQSFVKLRDFVHMASAVTAAEAKKIMGYNAIFKRTVLVLPDDAGAALAAHMHQVAEWERDAGTPPSFISQ